MNAAMVSHRADVRRVSRRDLPDMESSRRRMRARASRGFTLVEAIVVIVILGILAGVIAPKLIKRIGQGKHAVATSSAATLMGAIRDYSISFGEPKEGDSIRILWDRPRDIDEGEWKANGPFIETADALIDPWGNEFVLEVPGRKGASVSVVSYGADGKPGGEGEDKDIIKP